MSDTGKTMTMRMAKADDADMDVAYDLNSLLENVQRGDFPPAEKDGEWEEFDEDSQDDLKKFYERAMATFDSGSLMRVVGAASVLLNPKNQIVNPELDYLDLHPRFAAMEAQLLTLASQAIAWWEEHQYDTCGERGGRNVFDSEPAFVTAAMAAVAAAKAGEK